MSAASSLGTQIAAIMDVLVKAAVSEITKLVDDGTVVLRLEMCRRDGEIQELKRSLQLMEIELCKAQEAAAEAATTRIADDNQEHEGVGIQISHTADQEDQEMPAMHFESKRGTSLCEVGHQPEESTDLGLMVKSEPVDKLATQDTLPNTGIANNVYFDVEEREGPFWPPARDMFDDDSVEPAHSLQQCLQIFSSHTEQYSAHNDTRSSCNSSSTTAGKVTGNLFGAQIKQEPEMQPVCLESIPADQYSHVSHPAVGEDRSLQARLLQAGPSQADPGMQRSTGNAPGSNTVHLQDHVLSRNAYRAKRPVNVWRANPKPFICSICGKGFPRLCQLEEHQSTHGAFKPFRCLECGKSFTQKTRLKTHQSVHTGERPFSCKICGKMFSRQDNCLRHERFHSGLKPYSCEQCGKSFTVLGNLKIHQEIHLRGR
ncbi:uncharacterized protein ACJ7VT_017180 [Polymixia lowei]